jgi:hypothetical protein
MCLARRFFPFVKLLFEELFSAPQKLRNIDSWAGFHFEVAIISNAQDQLRHYVCAEVGGFRDRGEP